MEADYCEIVYSYLYRILKNKSVGEPVDPDLIRQFVFSKPVKEIHQSFWVEK
jgi:hypothetical protein